MASKVLVKIPVAPFGHVNKGGKTPSGNPNDVSASPSSTTASVTAEIVTVGAGTSRCTDPLLRIAQLEQNIRFLQEQHAQMLAGLHQEIDTLRQRNRDLQFQLVFSKGQIATPNSASPSSPEEDSKNRVLSPRQVNITPLQVELLEREIGELKITLNEVNTKNAYLTAIVDEQKKKLERINQDNSTAVSVPPDPELISKLDDVETLVRKLRRENDDLRREVSDMRSQPPQQAQPQSQTQLQPQPPLQLQLQNNGQNQQFQHQQHRGGRHRGGHYRGHRFPPLHTQSYWQGGRSQDKDDGTSAGTSLPSLNMNGGQPLQHHQQHGGGTGGPPHHNGHGGHGHGHGHGHGGHYSGGKRSGGNNHNNHQYHQGGNGNGNANGNGGKYRGSQSRGHKS